MKIVNYGKMDMTFLKQYTFCGYITILILLSCINSLEKDMKKTLTIIIPSTNMDETLKIPGEVVF